MFFINSTKIMAIFNSYLPKNTFNNELAVLYIQYNDYNLYIFRVLHLKDCVAQFLCILNSAALMKFILFNILSDKKFLDKPSDEINQPKILPCHS